jgi:hypothetical protein
LALKLWKIGSLNFCVATFRKSLVKVTQPAGAAAIRDFYTEDCVLYVPPGVFVGHDALDKFAGDLRATHPHFVYTPHGEAQALHNGGILAWGSGLEGKAPDYTGLDVVIVRDGKIAALYVFLNPKFA